MLLGQTHLAFGCFALRIFAAAASAAPSCEADNGGITLPRGFCALVAGDALGAARHIALSSSGDVYVGLQGDGEKGGVVALRDTNGDGKFEMQEHFGSGSLTGIALRNGYPYVAAFNTVRYKMTPGQFKPAGEPETIVTGIPGVRQHGDRGLTFEGKGSLYVNVGAPSNACQTRDRQAKSPAQDPCPILEKNGGIWKSDENELGQKQEDGTRFATCLGQMPAIAWHGDALYIAMNNRDQLDVLWPGTFTVNVNAERPAEPLYRAVSGSNFGWPYGFYDYGQKKFLLNPEYDGDGKTVGRCSDFTPPVAAFPAHRAPVDIMFHSGKQFPSRFKDGAFIAFHGSWNREPEEQAGNNIKFQPFSGGKPAGEFEVFASCFTGKPSLLNPANAVGRSDGVAEAPDGSLYITDSQKRKLWRVMYQAWK